MNPVFIARAHMLRIPLYFASIFYEIVFKLKIFYKPLVCCQYLYVSSAPFMYIYSMPDWLNLFYPVFFFQGLDYGVARLLHMKPFELPGFLIQNAIFVQYLNRLKTEFLNPLDIIHISISAMVDYARAEFHVNVLVCSYN